jgi:putative toxin-antitoxin system antitoxin component (TIGR02293 family)
LITGEKFMSAKPLAEVYEELKELRRRGRLPDGSLAEAIASDPKQTPDRYRAFAEMIPPGAAFFPWIEILTLADRIFSDENKTETWLFRPNASMSGQRPVDLMRDELGLAVVRETLERIDHGIFA